MELTDILTPEVTTLIAQAVLALLGTLLTAVLTVGIRLIRAKTTTEQFEFIQQAAAIAVSAAEQLGLNGAIEDKKSAALVMLESELARRGIKVTAEQLDTALEAAVLDAFNAGRAPQDVTIDADIVQTADPMYGRDFGRIG